MPPAQGFSKLSIKKQVKDMNRYINKENYRWQINL
jgi:hypothetical protein